jgi:hypothetical protein
MLACALHIVVVYSGLLLAHGLNPLKFFRGAAPGMQVAFVQFEQLRVLAGVVAQRHPQPRRGQGLRRVRGAAGREHQDGRLRRDLPGADRRSSWRSTSASNCRCRSTSIIALASVLGSFGTAGVPGTAVIMATVVLSAAGLPLETIGYLYAIDRILDMMRTMTNVTGQMLVPVLVAKETGMLDRTIYEAASTDVALDEYRA